MKVADFIEREKIPANRSAGFLAHLRATEDHEFTEDRLKTEYAAFRGVPIKAERATGERQGKPDVPPQEPAAEKQGKQAPSKA